MDDRDVTNSSSMPTSARETVSSSREMLLEHDARASQPNVLAVNQRVVQAATGGTEHEHHDIPIDTPRFQALRGAAPPPANGSAPSALPDAYTGSITDSDLSSLPSGSNSARCSNSGRYPPPFFSHISSKAQPFYFLSLAQGIRCGWASQRRVRLGFADTRSS
jgi:hypothetical protein